MMSGYKFPNDEQEQDRLDMFHHIFKLALGGKLFLAPIQREGPLRILDIGTGTGIWAIEMGKLKLSFGEHSFLPHHYHLEKTN